MKASEIMRKKFTQQIIERLQANAKLANENFRLKNIHDSTIGNTKNHQKMIDEKAKEYGTKMKIYEERVNGTLITLNLQGIITEDERDCIMSYLYTEEDEELSEFVSNYKK